MRLGIFTGLLYIAYAINPSYMTSLESSKSDVFLVGLVSCIALITDLKDLFKKDKP